MIGKVLRLNNMKYRVESESLDLGHDISEFATECQRYFVVCEDANGVLWRTTEGYDSLYDAVNESGAVETTVNKQAKEMASSLMKILAEKSKPPQQGMDWDPYP